MKRVLAITAAAVALVGVAGVLLAPTLAQRYAEAQVDKALKRIRIQTTSTVDRGAVTVDLGTRTVTVHDLVVESAGRAQRIGISSLSVVGPHVADDLLTAEKVAFDGVTVRSAGETVTVPRIEISNYSGPERGLTATPGVGRNARNQADLIALVSLERAVAPLVTFSGDQSQIRRTLRNLSVDRVSKGVVESATVDGVAIDAPYVSPEQSPETSSLAISAGPVIYEGLDLATLWRFYAGDGAGDRRPFLKSGVAANVSAVAIQRPGGVIRGSWRRLTIEDVKLRPLAFPVTAFDALISKLREGAAATPSEIREQLLFGADSLRAASFGRIRVEGAKAEIARDGEPARRIEASAAEVGPYADGRLDAVKVAGFRLTRDDGARLAFEKAEAYGFAAAGFLDYADRIGRDEVLMTTRPTAAEFVKYAPRLTSAEAFGLDAASSAGAIKARSAKLKVDAPLDAVPQSVALDLRGLDATPSSGSRFAEAFAAMRLDALKGGLSVALTLEPTTKILKLDRFDYRFEELGTIRASGEMSNVDPLLAVDRGAAFVDKFSAIELGTFKASLTDDGAVDTLIRRAADKAGTPPDVYREETAKDVDETIQRVLGPPAASTAEAAARFIRDPKSLEVILTPRGATATLLDLIRAFGLGPAGIAQVIEASAVYRR